MIYKNEDGSIYKIEFSISPAIPDYEINERVSEIEKKLIAPSNAINSNKEKLGEIVEVLNYLLKKTKHLPKETTKLPKPNTGEVVIKGG